MFLKNKNIIFKIRRSKVTDYAALSIVLLSTFGYIKRVSRTLYLLGHTLLTFSQSALRYYGCERLSVSGRQSDLYRISYKMLLIVFLYGDVKFI